MKKILFFAMLCAGFAAHSQTDADFCADAQTNYDLQKYDAAMKSAGRALAKNSDAPCRRVRINAALQAEPTSAHFIQAVSDIEYLMAKGDKSENIYKMLGDAQSGLGKINFDSKNFSESIKHYQRAKTAYQSAKTIGNTTSHDAKMANIDNQIKQAELQKQ